MNWDNQLSNMLSAADGSVAKIRERLATSSGKFSLGREDLFPVREVSNVTDVEPPPLPPLTQPSSSQSSALQWADLASHQSQLQLHSQAIESLTEKLHNMALERHSQQRHLQALQEEVCRLREEARQRDRERDEERKAPSLGASDRMQEQWRREVGRELSSLRGHIARATSLGNLEESFSTKLRREELDHLRREVDQLKTQLKRQEEDMFLQQSESRETRRQYERSCKTLEELTDSYRTHSIDLTKTASQYTQTQQEVRQIRASVTELKDEVRNLNLRDRQSSLLCSPVVQPLTAALSPVPAPVPSRRVRVHQEADSDSEDLSPTPSLAEVSSDDLSWLEDQVAPRQGLPRTRRNSGGSDFEGVGSGLDDDDGDDDGDGNLGLGSDLSLNDL